MGTHLLYALASLLLVPLVIALWRIDVRRGGVLRFIGGVLLMIGAVGNARVRSSTVDSAGGCMLRAGVVP